MAHGRMGIIQQSQEQVDPQDSGARGQHEEKVLRHSEHEMRSWTDKDYNSQKLKYPNGALHRYNQEQGICSKNSVLYGKIATLKKKNENENCVPLSNVSI